MFNSSSTIRIVGLVVCLHRFRMKSVDALRSLYLLQYIKQSLTVFLHGSHRFAEFGGEFVEKRVDASAPLRGQLIEKFVFSRQGFDKVNKLLL